MTRAGKFAFYSAITGFVLPLLLLGFYAVADSFGYHPTANLLFYACPQATLAMIIKKDSWVVLLMVWLILCISNAVLYAFPGLLAVLVMGFVRPTPTPPSILK